MPTLGPFEFAIILVIFFIFFGAGKLGQVGGAFRRSVDLFKQNAGIGQGEKKKQDESPTEGLAGERVIMPDTEPLTLTILAGGRGSRLGGVDKAAIDLAGRPLLERVLDSLGPLASQTLAIANDDRLAGDARLTVIRDPEPHAGVLPALLAALDAATSPLMLLVACDMPFVSRRVVRHLLAYAESRDVVMPRVDGFEQPMHAIYRVERCRAAVRSTLALGKRRMIAFLDDVDTLYVEEEELRRLDPDLRSFFNVNTPDDLTLAATLAAGSVS